MRWGHQKTAFGEMQTSLLPSSWGVGGACRDLNLKKEMKADRKHIVKYSQKEYREEFLLSDEWRSISKKIREKVNKCENVHCDGICKLLDVHHSNYEQTLGIPLRFSRRFLVVLCRSCHKMIEKAKKIVMIPVNHNSFTAKKICKKDIDLWVSGPMIKKYWHKSDISGLVVFYGETNKRKKNKSSKKSIGWF